MVNVITQQTIADGDLNLIVKYNIVGDGSGEETNTILVDASSFNPVYTNCRLMRIDYGFDGFAASLLWDGTLTANDKPLLTLPEEHVAALDFHDENYMGGIPNNVTVGQTGDILITTVGLGSGDTGHIILYIKKKNP